MSSSRPLRALMGLDLLADEARFLLVVPEARDAHPRALLALGPKGLAEPRAVVRDQARGRAQDVPGRAIVALEPDHPGAREILLEPQDVSDFGAPPAVDRLVIVADAGDIFVTLGEQAEPEILGDVGVLVLVDQERTEAPLIVGQDLRLLVEQGQAVQEQIAEIAGIQRQQAFLIGGIELARAAECEVADLALGHVGSGQTAVLEALDDRQQHARRPAAGIELGRLDHLLDQAQLVVGIEDREVGLEPDQFGVAAQQAGAERVEGAEPEALDALAEQQRDAQDHLARGLVGEGHREHLPGPHPAGQQHMRKPRGQHPGLAGAGAGQYQERPVRRLDRRPLLRIERVEIARRWRCRRRRQIRRRHHVCLIRHGTPCGSGPTSDGARPRAVPQDAPSRPWRRPRRSIDDALSSYRTAP